MSKRGIDPERTGNFIKRLRLSRHLTQEDLADSIFLTRKAVSKWETAKCAPSLDSLKLLSEALGVTLDELSNGGFAPVKEETTFDIIIKFFKASWMRVVGVAAAILLAIIIGVAIAYYFLSDKSYLLNYEDANFTITNGIIVLSFKESYIDIGDLYFNIDGVTSDTKFDIELYYQDDAGNEVSIMSFNAEGLIFLDNNMRDELKKVLKEHMDSIYYRMKYVDASGKKHSFDLKMIVAKKTKKEIEKATPKAANLLSDDYVEDGINLSFLFDLEEERLIEIAAASKNDSKSRYTINYDLEDNNLSITFDAGSVFISTNSKTISFITDELESVTINNNIIFKNEISGTNYKSLYDIVKVLQKLVDSH